MDSDIFQIDTKGKCLLCLSNCTNGGGYLSATPKVPPNPTAFRMILRYLKIDIMKLGHFSSSAFCPPPSSPDSNNGLSVELCNRCYSLIKQFHQLFQKFESIRMDLDNYAGKLRDAIEEGDKDVDRVREYRNLVKPPAKGSIRPVDALNASLAESLRRETMEKCAKRISFSTPRVFIIPDEGVPTAKRQKSPTDSTCFSSSQIGIKMEESSEEEGPGPKIVNCLTIASISNDDAIGRGETIYDGTCLLEQDPLSEIRDTFDLQSATESITLPTPVKMEEPFQAVEEPRKISRKVSRKISKRGDASVQCPHCSTRLSGKPKLRIHLIQTHTFLHFSHRLPQGTTEQQLRSAIRVTLAKRNRFGWMRNRSGKRTISGCPLCRRPFRDMKLHILTAHFDQVVSNYFGRVGEEQEGSPPFPAKDPLEL